MNLIKALFGNQKRRFMTLVVVCCYSLYLLASSVNIFGDSIHNTATGTATGTVANADANASSFSAKEIAERAIQKESTLLSNIDKLCNNNNKDNNKSNKDSYSLASQQSFGFFNDIPCSSWNRLRQITSHRAQNQHAHPDNPNYRINIPHSWYQMNYEPNFSCQFEQRIGGNGNGDGPKWICDPHRLIDISKQRKQKHNAGVDDKDNKPGCVIYSIGSNGDFQFEQGLQTLLGPSTCEVHIFDMGDYHHLMPKDINLHFHHWGITNNSSAKTAVVGKPSQAFFEGSLQKKLSRWFGFRKEQFKSFQETVKILGHENLDAIDILKIDCEGCEWDVYKDWFSNDIPRIGQVLVEVHKSPKDKAIDFFDEMYKNGYVTFHKEFNTQYAYGNCVEYAFLKLDKEYFEYEV